MGRNLKWRVNFFITNSSMCLLWRSVWGVLFTCQLSIGGYIAGLVTTLQHQLHFKSQRIHGGFIGNLYILGVYDPLLTLVNCVIFFNFIEKWFQMVQSSTYRRMLSAAFDDSTYNCFSVSPAWPVNIKYLIIIIITCVS